MPPSVFLNEVDRVNFLLTPMTYNTLWSYSIFNLILARKCPALNIFFTLKCCFIYPHSFLTLLFTCQFAEPSIRSFTLCFAERRAEWLAFLFRILVFLCSNFGLVTEYTDSFLVFFSILPGTCHGNTLKKTINESFIPFPIHYPLVIVVCYIDWANHSIVMWAVCFYSFFTVCASKKRPVWWSRSVSILWEKVGNPLD